MLEDGLSRAEVRGKSRKTQAAQNGQFSQIENSIDLSYKDDDLVAIFLFESLSPTRGAFSTQQSATEADQGRWLL